MDGKREVFTKRVKGPDGKEILVTKLRGGRGTSTEAPRRGPGSYKREKFRYDGGSDEASTNVVSNYLNSADEE